MKLEYPDKVITEIVQFLQKKFEQTGTKNGVIAVSGGIDSALSTTLLVKALGAQHVYPIMLPYKNQSTVDSELICTWNKIPRKNWRVVNIEGFVMAAEKVLPGVEKDKMRLGNLMARSRMLVVFDRAKEFDALVCGTENKSEKYLGYFTRFGDEASDLEPIISLYKTQVRQLVELLEMPKAFLEKAPSAELWEEQTDETELGFSYAEADAVFQILIEKQMGKLYVQLIEGDRTAAVAKEIHEQLPDIALKQITAILQQVQRQQFKHEVPYTFDM
jgi:NAD+ synthase